MPSMTLSGSVSSGKIASTGHSGSQTRSPMHSSGSMMRIRSNSWMQSTGQTSTHERSLMSMQGSAMMYVTEPSLASGPRELFHELRRPLDERRFHDHLVEPRSVSPLEPCSVRVVREPHDRDVG